MARFISQMPFVSLADVPDAHMLTGDLRGRPMCAGQTVAAHGLFDDGTKTGVGLFFVLRNATDGGCEVAPLGVENDYWRSHLEQRASCTAVFLKKVGQTIPVSKEMFSKWKILAEPGADVDLGEGFPWLGKLGAVAARHKIDFLRTYVVSDAAAAPAKVPNRRDKRKRGDYEEELEGPDGPAAGGDDDAQREAEERMLKGIDEKNGGREVKPKLGKTGALGSFPTGLRERAER